MAQWQQGQVVEVTIVDLNDQGAGVGRLDNWVVFVPDTVPGDRVQVRLVQVKRQYGYGQLQRVITPSPDRCRPACIVADKCGGCQWQTVAYERQLAAKQNQVIQALQRLAALPVPAVAPILAAAHPLGYRNKATYPLRRSATGQVQAGYYRKRSHRLINLNQCPVQDPRLDPLLAGIKPDLTAQGWSIYDEATHQGTLRHLALRIGRRTGEILLTLVVRDYRLPNLETQVRTWLQRYPRLVGVCLNHNPDRTNVIFGEETACVAGRAYLYEEFAGLRFRVEPTTFFQVYTEQAEQLFLKLCDRLRLTGHEILIDAYCGVGSFTLPLAQRVRQVIGLEVSAVAIAQARMNAAENQITNVSFQVGRVEDWLPQLTVQPDVVWLDPPRKGCDRRVLDALLTLKPQHIVYISCKPATLARDLKVLCQEGEYQVKWVQPADFFPQTPHVECAVWLWR
ncbi:23S rRNA (uracil(1939)-C(5))-methyltransferase RlmD [Trichothermofontia sichuanensis B231]|uniref:23S rRNA (uracil(1939)-C(5))-methyltransferase RlmD n=1 Tax=Trichothermofontia sichuanensis TaxID=3045816 RepID=UPI0022457948|nr:23S rRNA (uracil(1939)-C(5))-methyltransferase RlmD [Trichothermofontia sichuanensis]UZQ53904.1 23S rRNA (uracil(1939)-C(5))-methyltransferase RlmD [Trichothermofontia sichuanensis B231]